MYLHWLRLWMAIFLKAFWLLKAYISTVVHFDKGGLATWYYITKDRFSFWGIYLFDSDSISMLLYILIVCSSESDARFLCKYNSQQNQYLSAWKGTCWLVPFLHLTFTQTSYSIYETIKCSRITRGKAAPTNSSRETNATYSIG